MSRTAWVGVGAVTACVAFAGTLIGQWGGYPFAKAVADYGLFAFAVFAAGCSALAASSVDGRQRRAWICLTVGLSGWAGGEALWILYEQVLHRSPFPSLADAGYLLFPIGAGVAIALFPAGYSGHSRVRLMFDGAIVAIALFEISWVLVMRGVYDAGHASTLALGLSLTYPVADIAILTVAFLVLARARTGRRMALAMLAAGVLGMALSDSAFAYLTAHGQYYSGHVIDIGWAAALLTFGMAALVSRRVREPEVVVSQVTSDISMWLPYIPVAFAALVCIPAYFPAPGLGPILVSSTLLMGAVMARQYVVVRQNRRLLKLVADQALRDTLTGLANRDLFNDRLMHAVQLHENDSQSVAVLSMDLDDFKLVNDSLGHPAGDALLMQAAERLLGCVRTSDTVARVGGDEFAVLMEGLPELSRLVAHRVVGAFEEPFVIDGQQLLMRPSVGLAVASSANPDLSADMLLKQADVAMYSAKRSKSGGLHTFTPDMALADLNEVELPTDVSETTERGAAVRLLGELRHAIDHGDLTVFYQPKFDLRTGDVVGVEALVRWPHPKRGLLGPAHFLPLVRKRGLMRAVTDIVLNQALDDAAEWQALGIGVPIAVNVFAPSLGDLDLPTHIASALAIRNLNPKDLTIEITEDFLLDNIERTRSVLERLRQRGIRIAIDDFGSGYSALWYLRELAIDEVKLDRHFIAPIRVDARAAAVVRGVVDLAHVLGVTTVAEGVENAETAERLREFGCEVAQGYYYSPPVSAAAMMNLLAAGQPKGVARAEFEKLGATSLPGPAATKSS
ncbi:putative bifunctional diguanylate cyclase/phosphodiesterase [Mycolicibacterium stellerae]|uniref:putative bifunctional diguanylate cyclase/phosphodiesterase n=1 Tax=Mycolicibacterium stellerae TaxID=2358193 RepID=UPI000F0B5C23|nr:bifunctional diguanylate cyclase/phosphodiesterase [Mycolicibacterium stellerae]